MDPLQFAYWLQGFAELNEQPPTAEQWQSIREHLGLVFNKVTPPVTVPTYFPPTYPTRTALPYEVTCSVQPAEAITLC